MSTTTTPAQPVAKPLISTSPANQATAAAAGFSGAGVMTIVIWVLSLIHVTMPPEVAAAMVGVVGSAVHWAILKYGLSSS